MLKVGKKGELVSLALVIIRVKEKQDNRYSNDSNKITKICQAETLIMKVDHKCA